MPESLYQNELGSPFIVLKYPYSLIFLNQYNYILQFLNTTVCKTCKFELFIYIYIYVFTLNLPLKRKKGIM